MQEAATEVQRGPQAVAREASGLPECLRALVSLVRSSPQPLCLLVESAAGPTHFSNAAFEALVQLGPEAQPIAGPAADTLRAAFADAVHAKKAAVIALPAVSVTVSPVLPSDGGACGALLAASPELAGRVQGPRRTELHALFQQAPAAICVLRGKDHVFEMANARFEQVHGGNRKLLGLPIREAMPELAGVGFYELLDRVYRTGEAFVGHEEPTRQGSHGARADESFFTFVYQPLRDLAGRVEGVALFGFDVSEQVRARHQIERLVAQARETDRRKDEFLAMLAHELRNPLAPLRTSLVLLRHSRAAGADVDRHLDVLDRQSENLARIVEDLLDVSRITRGKIELRRERLTLSSVVQRAVDATRALLEARRHALTVKLPRRVLEVVADPVRLEQILVNLLTNAAKYTEPDGRITIAVERRGEMAELRVSDTGQGIPRDMLGKVFDLFTQAERGLDRSQGGLGIGLTIVRNLVTMHGGTVEATSAGRGQGSEFIVRVPAVPEEVRAAADEDRLEDALPGEQRRPSAATASHGGRTGGLEARPVKVAAEPAAEVPAARRKVLLVDDNVDAAETLAEFLEVLGHDVKVAHDGTAALEAARRWTADLVLLDIGLPGMDGYQVARELRLLPEPPRSIIALSGYGQESDRKRSTEAGFDAHLVKPVELSRLEALLDRPPHR